MEEEVEVEVVEVEAVAGSGASSRTVLPPRPVRWAVMDRLVRATPARWRARGESGLER